MKNTMYTWPLQEAKNKLSQLVVSAQQGAPQYITKRGEEAAVLISTKEYKKAYKPAQPFNEFLAAEPFIEGLEIER
jgi:antitoxin Phd